MLAAERLSLFPRDESAWVLQNRRAIYTLPSSVFSSIGLNIYAVPSHVQKILCSSISFNWICRGKGRRGDMAFSCQLEASQNLLVWIIFLQIFFWKVISLSGCLLAGRNDWLSSNIPSLLFPLIIELLSFSQAHCCPTKDCISQPPLKPDMNMWLSPDQEDVIYIYILQPSAWNVTWCGAILNQMKQTI